MLTSSAYTAGRNRRHQPVRREPVQPKDVYRNMRTGQAFVVTVTPATGT